MIRRLHCFLIGGLVSGMLTSSHDLSAQSFWNPSHFQKAISIEGWLPVFQNRDAEKYYGFLTYVRVRWPLSKTVLFLGELPVMFSAVNYDGPSGTTRQSAMVLGKPLLGLVLMQTKDFQTTIGVRITDIPKLDRDLLYPSVITWFDHIGAFFPGTVAVSADVVGTTHIRKTGGFYRIYVGSEILFKTKRGAFEGGFDSPFPILKYGLQAGYQYGQLGLAAGVSGLLVSRETLVIGWGVGFWINGHQMDMGLIFRKPLMDWLRNSPRFLLSGYLTMKL